MKYILLILLLFVQEKADCAIADVFKDCTLPNQDNNNNDSTVYKKIAFPQSVKYTDAIYCDSVCTRSFSSDDLSGIGEINNDLILNCKNICLDKRSEVDEWSYSAGKKISLRRTFSQQVNYIDENGRTKTSTNSINYSVYPYTQPLSIKFSSSSNNNKATDCYFSYPLNEKILKIQRNDGEDNRIYNCGHQIITLNPIFPNLFEMSPKTISGGNVAELNINFDNSKSLSEVLISNRKYAGVYNFDFDGYVRSFEYDPSDFDNLQTIVTRLFCDIYKQQVISNNQSFDCGTAAQNNGFDASVCSLCNTPTDRERYRSKVRTGLMTQQECENSVSNNNKESYCNIPRYSLISMDQIKAYNKITTNGKFFTSSFANSTTESAWDKTTMSYHPCFTDLTTPPKNKDIISNNIKQDYYSTPITFDYWYYNVDGTNYPDREYNADKSTYRVIYKTQRVATWDTDSKQYVVRRIFSPKVPDTNNIETLWILISNAYVRDYSNNIDNYLSLNDSYDFFVQPENLPQSNDKIVELNEEPKQVGCFADWIIYNENFTDLGITVSDGDNLSISWGGNVILGNGLTIPFIDQAMAKRIAVGDTSIFENFSLSRPANIVNGLKFLRIISSLEFQGLGTLVGEDGSLPQMPSNLQPNEGNICNGKTIYDDLGNGIPTKWYGLNGQIRRTAGSPINQSNTTNTSSYGNTASCQESNIQGDRYIFKGKLSGNGSNKRLKIKYYSPKTYEEQVLFANSILNGGFQITIDKGGCPSDNTSLKIAFGDSNSENSLNWSTINSNQLGSGYIIAPDSVIDGGSVQIDNKYSHNDNTLLFLTADTATNTPIVIDGVNTAIPDGGENIRITELVDARKDDTSFLSGIFSTGNEFASKFDLTKQIAETIFTTLIGDPENIDSGKRFDGVIVMLSIAFCESISTIVRAMLVLYIGLLGIQFMIGTVQMNQKELIGRLIKISVVMMMFSPTAWDWFTQNYIRMCIVGSLKLALEFQNMIYSILSKAEIINDSVFSLFSMWKLFFYVIQQTFTAKLIALAFSSLAGLAIAIIIVYGVVKSFLIIIEGIFVYLSAILTQSVLLIMSPLFFPFKLFKKTEDLFDRWAKQVISFAIIPSTVAISITLYFLLLLIGIDAVMGFSYCKACWISIFSFCLVDTFYILDLSFIPHNGASDFVLPMGIVSGALTFLIITHTGKNVVKLAVGMISRIITFQAQTLGQNSMVGVMSLAAKSAIGIVAQTTEKIGGGSSTDKELTKQRDLGSIGDKIKDFDRFGK